MIDPDGGRVTYSYDDVNRLNLLVNAQAARTSFAYDARGGRTVKKLANGTRASYTYDATGRVAGDNLRFLIFEPRKRRKQIAPRELGSQFSGARMLMLIFIKDFTLL
ncbi:hypothetical protein [Thalassoglobus sp.]|uniref:hypothetical protein n=1 Tax=Thalassoglobus sp. TaxID=2795869 RepID=UPI003AA864F1